MALLAGDFQSPDGIEMAAAGQCMLMAIANPNACAGLEPWLWPPAFPVLSGLLALLADKPLAARTISIFCSALLMIPLMSMATRTRGHVAAMMVPILFVATPALRLHAAAGDARSLGLLGLLGAWALATEGKGKGWAIGLLCGLAGLSRPEGVIGAGLVLVWLLWSRRAMLLRASVAFIMAMGPWWAALSHTSGQPALTGRAWTGRAYGWMGAMPNDWIIQELGVGARNTPLRIALSSTTESAMRQDTFDPVSGSMWLLNALMQSIPIWLMVFSAVGFGVLIASKNKDILSFSAIFAGFALVLGLFVQTQDDQIPANNLLPVLMALLLMASIGIAYVVERTKPVAGFIIAGACIIVGTSRSDGQHLHQASTVTAASQWLQENTSEEAIIAATLKSAQIVHQADRQRTRFPSPWIARTWNSSPEQADFLIVTDLDIPEVNASLRTLGEQDDLALIAYAHNHDGWSAIFKVK